MANALVPSTVLKSLLLRCFVPACSITLATAALICLSPPASAEGPKLESREYKLMLAPVKFEGNAHSAVNRLWEEKLKPVIEERLDRRNGGEFRHKGNFGPGAERFVSFRDTKDCLLNAHGYSLRQRIRVKDGRRELTVKFRTPDIFLAAQSWIGDAGDDTKFEEDIAPLIERTVTAPGKVSAAYARPPTMRSLFSQSTTERIDAGLALESLPDVFARYPKLETSLRTAGVKADALQAPLVLGPRFHERVFSGARVDLGKKVDGKFDLTLWYPEGKAEPQLAELSYKYDTSDGDVSDEVAGRALILFRALQQMLRDWASPERETKTSMGLPESCPD